MGVLKQGAVVLIAVQAAACATPVDVDESVITEERLIAVRATPAEAEPGDTVRLEALVYDADGEVVEGRLGWATCIARRPASELSPVNLACIEGDGSGLLDEGSGYAVEIEVPRDACRLFGSDPPPAEDGQPAGRPADPDATGGYRLPVIVSVDGTPSLATVRLACGAPGATREVAAELRRRSRPNTNPHIASIVRLGDEQAPLSLENPVEVGAGELLQLRVQWPQCPTSDRCGDGICGIDEDTTICPDDCREPAGCGGAERYVTFDVTERAARESRESMRVSWLTTGGRFESERTGRDGGQAEAYSDNVWIAPSEPGEVELVFVLRDERGGVTWRTARVRIRE